MPTWKQIQDEVSKVEDDAKKAFDLVRKKYLKRLHQKTKRNVIAYYSGWLTHQAPNLTLITDEDKNAFMMCVHGLDCNIGLDLILHTPGGDIAATHSLIDYLRRKFGKNIRAIVPQIAMSAGTIMACCCNSILMARHSNLGPIDPLVDSKPAFGVISEFKRAYQEVTSKPETARIWQFIIGQYPPAFLGRCQNAIDWSNAFVEEQLRTVMFDGRSDAAQAAKTIVASLSDHDTNKTHSKHLHLDECLSLGLNIEKIEDDAELQDLILTVHHCYMHVTQNRGVVKAIENHKGVGMFKRLAIKPA